MRFVFSWKVQKRGSRFFWSVGGKARDVWRERGRMKERGRRRRGKKGRTESGEGKEGCPTFDVP